MSEEALERFGKYFLLDKVGAGGMAEIFRARPASVDANGRVVVIKRVLRRVASDPDFLKMFRTEIQVCMGLNHPNVVQIHDFGEVARQPYLAMEFVDGKNLKEIMLGYTEENERVPVELAMYVIEEAAQGLAYAHEFQSPATGEKLNIVHRDISPQNILVAYDGHVKVIDFGIAKARHKTGETTQDGVIKGKIRYLSPEQVRCEPLDSRSDIFSLGIVLWELLAGRKLFELPGKPDLEILQAIENCDEFVKPPSQFNPAVSPELDAIVLKAMRKKREQRYASAAEFGEELRRLRSAAKPDFTKTDVVSSVKRIFETQIRIDRELLRELNEKAQLTLTMLKTSGTGSFRADGSRIEPDAPKPRLLARFISEKNEKRMLATLLYVLTFALVKLDQRYLVIDRLFPASSTETVQVVELKQAAGKNKTKRQVSTAPKPRRNGDHRPE